MITVRSKEKQSRRSNINVKGPLRFEIPWHSNLWQKPSQFPTCLTYSSSPCHDNYFWRWSSTWRCAQSWAGWKILSLKNSVGDEAREHTGTWWAAPRRCYLHVAVVWWRMAHHFIICTGFLPHSSETSRKTIFEGFTSFILQPSSAQETSATLGPAIPSHPQPSPAIPGTAWLKWRPTTWWRTPQAALGCFGAPILAAGRRAAWITGPEMERSCRALFMKLCCFCKCLFLPHGIFRNWKGRAWGPCLDPLFIF